MNWTRYIKRTAVRRVVWIVVGVVVYAVAGFVQEAVAQSGPPVPCPSGGDCNVQEAYQACVAVLAWADAGNDPLWVPGSGECYAVNPQSNSGSWSPRGRRTNGNPYTISGRVSWWYSRCPSGHWDDEFKRCNDCGSRNGLEFNRNVSLHGPPPFYVCDNSCDFVKQVDPPGQFCSLVEEGSSAGYWCNSVYSPTGAMCTGGGDGTAPGDGVDPPIDPDAPPKACGVGEVRLPTGECSPRGECPLGQHEVNGECHPTGSCPTGHVKAPDGSCSPESCPVNFVRGADGTCKVDDNNDGTPDEDEPGGDGDNPDGKKFSGGESCEVPPTCSGDAIMCGQARIQWRIDCNTRTQANVTGGDHCDNFNMPVCVGENCDPIEHKQMVLQWQAVCALESLVNQAGDGDGEGSGGDADFDAYAAGEGDADGVSGGGITPESLFDDCEGSECASGELDRSGYGYGSGCPAPPSFSFRGETYEFNTAPLCEWMTLGSYFVLLLAGLASARIIAGVR